MTRRPLALAALAVAFLGVVRLAPGQGDPEPDAPKIDVKERVLANGLRVLVAPRKGAPRVACALWFRAGSVDEPPGKTGLAHVLEHMMFKGTTRIGVKDPSIEPALQRALDEAWRRRREVELRAGARTTKLREEARARRELRREVFTRLVTPGRTDLPDDLAWLEQASQALVRAEQDASPDAALGRELAAADQELGRLTLVERRNDKREELWDLYVRAGATGLNAFTTEDSTQYVVTLPSSALELFFWIEGDRLRDPVFRELYPEKDVVMDERRTDEATPDGPYTESLAATAYGPHPYAHPVLGWMEDLDAIERKDVQRFFDVFYGPSNATCVLVGDVDPERAFALAERYLGTIPKRAAPPEPSVVEPTQAGEKRLTVEAESEPRIEFLFRTPPPADKDHDTLAVIAALLGGDRGRLAKNLVHEQELATSVEVTNDVHRYGARFRISVKAKPEAALEEIEAELRAELTGLAQDELAEDELPKARRRIEAEHLRGLEEPEALAEKLGLAAVTTAWPRALDLPARVAAVTAEDVRRVAAKLFDSRRLTIGILKRPEGDEPAPPPDEEEKPRHKKKEKEEGAPKDEKRPPTPPRKDDEEGNDR